MDEIIKKLAELNNRELIPYEVQNLCPVRTGSAERILKSAINVAAIITGQRWEDLIRSLIEQAHIRGCMPTDKVCRTDMLRANGFKPCHGMNDAEELFRQCNQNFAEQRLYAVKLADSSYLALVPDARRGSYIFKGRTPDRLQSGMLATDEIWMYVPGTDNRTGIQRSRSAQFMPEEHRGFTVRNLNPKGRRVGDCVIRALAAVCECSWQDAVDQIARATRYVDPVINSTPNVITTLIKLDFERHSGVKYDGRYLSGVQLCERLNLTYSAGERIFAFVGKNHCVAILPVLEDGKYLYKIQDTWDSTDNEIIEYWVYKKPMPEKDTSRLKVSGYAVGDTVVHPQFGTGRIIGVSGAGDRKILEIDFGSAGVKKLSEAWIKNSVKT